MIDATHPMRSCRFRHPDPVPEACAVCRLYERLGKRGGRCRHLGGPTGEVRKCASCTDREDPVFSCAAHGECTRSLLVAGLACCKVCDEHQPAEVTQ